MARYRLFSGAIPAAGTTISDVISGLTEVGDLLAQCAFDYGSGGTSIKAYIQTSLDGATWIDLACFAPANADTTRYFDINAGASIADNVAATDGSLTDNTSVDGIIGDQLRLKLVVVGTYAASTLVVYVETKQGLAGGGGSGLSAGDLTALEHIGVTQEAATVPVATTMQSAAVANGNGTSLPVTGYATAILNVVSSVAMSGGTTVNFEASVDDTTWVAISAQQVGGSGRPMQSTTADGDFRLTIAGYKSVRARISGYSAGTVTVKGYASPLVGPISSVGIAGIVAEQAALTAGSLNADLVPSTDVSAYKTWSLQILGTWSGTLTFQGSNDNSTWVSTTCQANTATNASAVITTTANNIFHGVVSFRYLRVRMTSYTSGTATGVLELSALPDVFATMAALATQSGTWTVQPGNTPNTVPWLVSQTPLTSGGLATYKRVSTADTNADTIKASAGQLYSLTVNNQNAAVRYVKLYNKASAPTVGTDVPVATYAIQPGQTLSVAFGGQGVAFATGIAVAMTTEATDAGSTGVAANEHVINAGYK